MEKIFWVDLEMTGLDINESVILEIAGIITDLELSELDRYHAIVYQPTEALNKMDAWNRETHSASGLLAQVPHGKPLARVEEETLAFLASHFEKGGPILAGNSIHQDRRFIERYMPDLADFLHYRMIDVSSFKQIFKYMYAKNYKKNSEHRAFDDIIASIDELKYYLSFLNIPRVGV